MAIDTPLRRRPALHLPLLIVIVFVVILVTCGHDKTNHMLDLVPEGDSDLIRALLKESNPDLASIAREKGFLTVKKTWEKISTAYHAARLEGRENDQVLLDSLLQRICQVLSSEYSSGFYTRYYRYHADTPEPQWTEYYRLIEKRITVMADTSFAPSEKIEVLVTMLPEAKTSKHPALAGQILSDISDLYSEIDTDVQLEYLHRSMAESRRNDFGVMLCQLYGVIGNFHRSAGQADSAIFYYNEGLRIAQARRFPYHAARIVSFLSILYQEQGRLALAHRLQKEAIAICRDYNGGEAVFRFVLMLADFYTDLGCWDIVSRLLQSAAVFDVSAPRSVADYNSLRYHTMRARLLIRENRIDEAEAILSALLPRTRLLRRRNHYPATLYWWSEDLLSQNLPEMAIPRIKEGMDYCQRRNLPERKTRFRILLATAYFKQGNFLLAKTALDDFEMDATEFHDIPAQDWVSHDALRIRLAVAHGLYDEARKMAARSFLRLRNFVRGSDASEYVAHDAQRFIELKAVPNFLAQR